MPHQFREASGPISGNTSMIKSGNTTSGTSSHQVCLKSVKSQVNRNRINGHYGTIREQVDDQPREHVRIKVLRPVWNQTQIKIPIHEKIIDELYKVWYVVADEYPKGN